MNWTAQTLLNSVLEFVAMTPDRANWSEAALSHNRPRLLRFQRITAAFRAFGVTEASKGVGGLRELFSFGRDRKHNGAENEVSRFLHGAFIERKSLSDFTELLPLIQDNAILKDQPTSLGDIQSLFWQLMSYRIAANNVLGHNSGVLGGSGKGFQAAMVLTNKANKTLWETVKPIDAILTQIIDPQRREISERTMTEECGFPSEDLGKVDMENY